jgi:hypothetical protein
MRDYPSGEVIARCLLLAATVATVAACGSQRSLSGGGGGLFGSVRISPATPVCLSGTTCSKPASNFKLVFSAGGRTVTATTDAKGRYRVNLGSGSYAVRAGTASTLPKRGLQPRKVTVPQGRFAELDFVYDSGIR